jgi:erythromycin esterase
VGPAWAGGGDGGGGEDALKARLEVGRLVGRVTGVLEHLQKERDRLAEAHDPAAVDWAVQNARVVVQAVTVLTGPPTYRDRCMADNVDWILRQHPPGTRVVLWAHNGHVAKRDGAMGSFLSRRHGQDVLVAGFAFHEGRYTAVAPGAGLRANDARPSEPGSVEWAVQQAGLPRAILDLRTADKDAPESAWLTAPVDHRNIGALATDLGFAPTVLPRVYDLLIAFGKTSPTRLLPPHRRD